MERPARNAELVRALAHSMLGCDSDTSFVWELAPYIGVTWSNAFGETADFAEAVGETPDSRRLVAGVRFWF